MSLADSVHEPATGALPNAAVDGLAGGAVGKEAPVTGASSPSAAPVSVQPAGTAEPVAPPAAASAHRRWLWAGAALLLLVGTLALAMAWRAQQRLHGLEQELVRRQQDSQSQAAEARVLAREAQDGMREGAAKLALLEARLAEVTLQRGQFEDLLQALTRSRDENLLIDIDSGIRVALQQSAITGSAEALVAALKQADERLLRHNQPRLEGVRRAIARDLDRARAAGSTDLPTLGIKLDEAVRMVDELPLLSTAATRRDGGGYTVDGAEVRAGAAAQPSAAASSADIAGDLSAWLKALDDGWSTVSERAWSEVRSLLRVTRIDHPEAALMAPENAFFVRENLKLRLLNARLALLSRQYDTAQSDLAWSLASLDRWFDRSSRRTVLTADLLRQVATLAKQVSLPRPDDTLAALAAVNMPAAGR